jgi:hypothetical protein
MRLGALSPIKGPPLGRRRTLGRSHENLMWAWVRPYVYIFSLLFLVVFGKARRPRDGACVLGGTCGVKPARSSLYGGVFKPLEPVRYAVLRLKGGEDEQKEPGQGWSELSEDGTERSTNPTSGAGDGWDLGDGIQYQVENASVGTKDDGAGDGRGRGWRSPQPVDEVFITLRVHRDDVRCCRGPEWVRLGAGLLPSGLEKARFQRLP